MGTAVAVRRVYDEPLSQDGSRVLVDRLWRRGLRKEHAQLAQWDRDVAPSNELREWYGHDPSKFAEFRRRYLAELAEPGRRAALEKLRALALNGPVTLLTATRDVDHSQAAVLAELLSVRQPPTGAGPPGAAGAVGEGGVVGERSARRRSRPGDRCRRRAVTGRAGLTWYVPNAAPSSPKATGKAAPRRESPATGSG